MTRARLANRRPALTEKVAWSQTGGPDHKLLVTFGLNTAGEVKEVFVAAFRAESTFCALVNDACILLSRALQHGDTVNELLASCTGNSDCTPASMVGAILRAAAALEQRLGGLAGRPR